MASPSRDTASQSRDLARLDGAILGLGVTSIGVRRGLIASRIGFPRLDVEPLRAGMGAA